MRNALPRHDQQGFALIAAVFILIVLAGLGVYMVSISAVQHRTSTLAINSTRAIYAAESGIEIAAYRALAGTCAGDTLAIDDFTVTITCTSSSHAERGDAFSVYRLEAVAEASTYGSPGYASRSIRATVTDAP